MSQGLFANGVGSVTYTITGTPASAGTATFAISLGGQSCSLLLTVTTLAAQYPGNSVFCANGPTAIVDVTNPTTGKTWMDRNLGASQVATSSTDQNAFGDLYQWGRRADGHQCRTSSPTSSYSSVDQPVHSLFIYVCNCDWRSPQNVNLWQGVNGVNNPCPNGYRIPTKIEIDTEASYWAGTNGAFNNTPLKLPQAGYRYTASQIDGSVGAYWSSTVENTGISWNLLFSPSNDGPNVFYRSLGLSVRCIKETMGSVGAINCGGATTSGNLFSGSAANNVSVSVPYTGGNGGFYAAQSISSTGVIGLTATLSQGLFANGAGSVTYSITGTPASAGTATFAISLGGQSCSFTVSVGLAIGQYPAGTVHCAGVTAVVDVTNPTTGKIWMDRNLGASQVATSSTDQNAYGDLYQWGRRADGHQCRTSPTTATLSSVDQPAHGNFISGYSDWRSPQNTNLWQGVNGINNPCPSAYRLPTEAEFIAERSSWGGQNYNSTGAFSSPLKWTVTGRRGVSSTLHDVGIIGHYWSSSVISTNSRYFFFESNDADMNDHNRANGMSVRCIKN
ncbi:MAG: hypothetical protein EB023_10945 [Flavobacteriia bacterium]|nr:hypothetical protein [Flavobacteriia bacterium]